MSEQTHDSAERQRFPLLLRELALGATATVAAGLLSSCSNSDPSRDTIPSSSYENTLPDQNRNDTEQDGYDMLARCGVTMPELLEGENGKVYAPFPTELQVAIKPESVTPESIGLHSETDVSLFAANASGEYEPVPELDLQEQSAQIREFTDGLEVFRFEERDGYRAEAQVTLLDGTDEVLRTITCAGVEATRTGIRDKDSAQA